MKTRSHEYRARRTLMYVEDLKAAADYYRNVLGFKVIGELPGANVELETGGPPLVLHQGGASVPVLESLKGAVPSFRVDDLPVAVARLEKQGVRTVGALREVPHGWIYFFADLEGNVIQLYQPKPESC